MKNSEINIHFIVGMSRAGTTWLMLCLNNHSEIVSFGETGFWGINKQKNEVYGAEEMKFLKEKLIHLGNSQPDLCAKEGGVGALMAKLLDEMIIDNKKYARKDIFIKLLEQIAKCNRKRIVVEKTPHHINHLTEIRSNLPNCKVIINQRDAKDFMLSYKHQGDRKRDAVKESFKKMYHPLGCTLVYRKYVKSINNALKLENTLLVKMEEIEHEPEIVLKKVQHFLEVNQLEEIQLPKANSSFPEGNSQQLQVDDLLWLWLFRFIPKMELTVKQRLALPFILILSILSIPVWAWNVISILRSVNLRRGLLKYLFGYLQK